MKFERFDFIFVRDRVYILPTIIIDTNNLMYYGKNLGIEFHFLFWNWRWLWIESEEVNGKKKMQKSKV